MSIHSSISVRFGHDGYSIFFVCTVSTFFRPNGESWSICSVKRHTVSAPCDGRGYFPLTLTGKRPVQTQRFEEERLYASFRPRSSCFLRVARRSPDPLHREDRDKRLPVPMKVLLQTMGPAGRALEQPTDVAVGRELSPQSAHRARSVAWLGARVRCHDSRSDSRKLCRSWKPRRGRTTRKEGDGDPTGNASATGRFGIQTLPAKKAGQATIGQERFVREEPCGSGIALGCSPGCPLGSEDI